MRLTRSPLACAIAALVLGIVDGSVTGATAAPEQSLTGVVRIVVADPPNGPAATRAVVDAGNRLLDLSAGQAQALHPGDVVSVTAVRGASSALSVHALAAASARSSARTSAASPVGSHSLTVLPVYWSQPDAATPSTLSALAAATADYWSQQSGGRISITSRVRPWTRITDPGRCSPSALANLALTADGLADPTSSLDHVLIYFPHRSDCDGWAGLAQISGSFIWDNGYPLIDVTAHEFGHNLGLGHANTALCTSTGVRTTLSDICQVNEYRDYADVMGGATGMTPGNLDAAFADVLGLAQVVTAPVGVRTSVEVAPLAQTQAVRAVRVRVPHGWVYADYRPAVGRDVRVPAWAGVQLHLLPDPPDGQAPTTRLLDGRPGSAEPFDSVALPPGTSWAVPGAGLTITVVARTAAAARLEVTPTLGRAAIPVPLITAPADRSVLGARAVLRWRLTSPVAWVRLLVDGRLQAQQPATGLTGSFPLTAASGKGLRDGSHRVLLQAVDATGRLGAPSSALTVVTDLTAPSTPTRLTLCGLDRLCWRPSTDAGSGVVGYRIALDGGTPRQVGRVSGMSARTPTGRHTWWVAAVDRAGNVSAATGLRVQRAGTRTRVVEPRRAP